MAQENVAQIAVPEEVQEAIEEVAEKSLKEEQKPEEIKIDTEIKPEDLSVGKARILPGSPFYGFKNLFRGVREGLTRNPLVKAELRLKHADERIIEAQQLIEEKGGGKAEEAAANVIQRATDDFEKIVSQNDDLKKIKTKDEARMGKFLDKIADHSLKQQVVLQNLGEQVPEKAFVKIEEMRQRHLEKFGQIMTGVGERPEEIANRLPQVVEGQKGSDFKELKAVEILRDLEDKVPEESREAIRMAQAVLSERFEQRMIALPEEAREEKFQKYVEFMPGNAIRQFEAFEAMRQNFQSPEMMKEMEIAKDGAIQKFENQFAQFQGEETRQAFMRPWRNGDPEDLRTMTEMEMRMEFPSDFQQFREETQNNFRDRFSENPEALRENPVFKKMGSRPDIVDLKLSQEMTKILDSKEFQNQAMQRFIENIEEEKAIPGFTFGPPVPGGLKVLQDIKDRVPLRAQGGIDWAMEAQTQTMERHMERIDDPQMFERYKQQIEGDVTIKRQVERFAPPTFFQRIEERGREMQTIEQQEQERRLQKIEEVQQQIFMAPADEGNQQRQEGIMQMIRPEMRREVEEFRQMVLPQSQPQFQPQAGFEPQPAPPAPQVQPQPGFEPQTQTQMAPQVQPQPAPGLESAPFQVPPQPIFPNFWQSLSGAVSNIFNR